MRVTNPILVLRRCRLSLLVVQKGPGSKMYGAIDDAMTVSYVPIKTKRKFSCANSGPMAGKVGHSRIIIRQDDALV